MHRLFTRSRSPAHKPAVVSVRASTAVRCLALSASTVLTQSVAAAAVAAAANAASPAASTAIGSIRYPFTVPLRRRAFHTSAARNAQQRTGAPPAAPGAGGGNDLDDEYAAMLELLNSSLPPAAGAAAAGAAAAKSNSRAGALSFGAPPTAPRATAGAGAGTRAPPGAVVPPKQSTPQRSAAPAAAAAAADSASILAAMQRRAAAQTAALERQTRAAEHKRAVGEHNRETAAMKHASQLPPPAIALINAPKILKAQRAWTSPRGQAVSERMDYVINRGRLEDMDVRRFIRNYIQQPATSASDLSRTDVWELLRQAAQTSKHQPFVKYHAELFSVPGNMTSVINHVMTPEPAPVDYMESLPFLHDDRSGSKDRLKEAIRESRADALKKKAEAALTGASRARARGNADGDDDDAPASGKPAADFKSRAAAATAGAAGGAAKPTPAASAAIDVDDGGDDDGSAGAMDGANARIRKSDSDFEDPFMRRLESDHWIDSVPFTKGQMKFIRDRGTNVKFGGGGLNAKDFKMREFWMETRKNLEDKKHALDALEDAKTARSDGPGQPVISDRVRAQIKLTNERFASAIEAAEKEAPEAVHDLYTFWTSLSESEKLDWIPFALTRAERGYGDIDQQAYDALEAKAGPLLMRSEALTILKPIKDEKQLAFRASMNTVAEASRLTIETNKYHLSSADGETDELLMGAHPENVEYRRTLFERSVLRAENDIALQLFGGSAGQGTSDVLAYGDASDSNLATRLSDFTLPLEDRTRKILNIKRILAGKAPLILPDAPIRNVHQTVKELRAELERSEAGFADMNGTKQRDNSIIEARRSQSGSDMVDPEQPNAWKPAIDFEDSKATSEWANARDVVGPGRVGRLAINKSPAEDRALTEDLPLPADVATGKIGAPARAISKIVHLVTGVKPAGDNSADAAADAAAAADSAAAAPSNGNGADAAKKAAADDQLNALIAAGKAEDAAKEFARLTDKESKSKDPPKNEWEDEPAAKPAAKPAVAAAAAAPAAPAAAPLGSATRRVASAPKVSADVAKRAKEATIAAIQKQLARGKVKSAPTAAQMEALLESMESFVSRHEDTTGRTPSERELFASFGLASRRSPAQVILDSAASASIEQMKKALDAANANLILSGGSKSDAPAGGAVSAMADSRGTKNDFKGEETEDGEPATAAGWDSIGWTLDAAGNKQSRLTAPDPAQAMFEDDHQPDITYTPAYVANPNKFHTSVMPFWQQTLNIMGPDMDEEAPVVAKRSDHTGRDARETLDDDELLSDRLEDRDPLYEHRQGMDYDFLQQLDPYSHGMEEMPNEKELYQSLKFMYVTDDVQEAMFALHYRDPAKYHPRYLSRMFNLGLPRTHAILRIKHNEKKFLAIRDAHKPPVSSKAPYADPRFTPAMRLNLTRAAEEPENALHINRAMDWFWDRVSSGNEPAAYERLSRSVRALQRKIAIGDFTSADVPYDAADVVATLTGAAATPAAAPTATGADGAAAAKAAAAMPSPAAMADAKAAVDAKSTPAAAAPAAAAVPAATTAAADTASGEPVLKSSIDESDDPADDGLENADWCSMRELAERYEALQKARVAATHTTDENFHKWVKTAAADQSGADPIIELTQYEREQRGEVDEDGNEIDPSEVAVTPGSTDGRLYGRSDKAIFRYYYSAEERDAHAQMTKSERIAALAEDQAARDLEEGIDDDVEVAQNPNVGITETEGLSDKPDFHDDVLTPELQRGRFFAFDPPNMKIAGRNARQHFLRDYDAYHFEEGEKKRADLFLDHQSALAARESKLLGQFGPLGSDMPPPKPPVVLEKRATSGARPARHHTVFMDLKAKKSARYDIVVRDKSGDLRTLSHREYVAMRKATSPAISGSPFKYTNKPVGGYWMNDAERVVWQAAADAKRTREIALARLQFLTRKQVQRALEWKVYHETHAAAGDARCRGSLIRARQFPESSEFSDYVSRTTAYAWEAEYLASDSGKALIAKLAAERKNPNYKIDAERARAERLAARTRRDKLKYAKELEAFELVMAQHKAAEAKQRAAAAAAELEVAKKQSDAAAAAKAAAAANFEKSLGSAAATPEKLFAPPA